VELCLSSSANEQRLKGENDEFSTVTPFIASEQDSLSPPKFLKRDDDISYRLFCYYIKITMIHQIGGFKPTLQTTQHFPKYKYVNRMLKSKILKRDYH